MPLVCNCTETECLLWVSCSENERTIIHLVDKNTNAVETSYLSLPEAFQQMKKGSLLLFLGDQGTGYYCQFLYKQQIIAKCEYQMCKISKCKPQKSIRQNTAYLWNKHINASHYSHVVILSCILPIIFIEPPPSHTYSQVIIGLYECAEMYLEHIQQYELQASRILFFYNIFT